MVKENYKVKSIKKELCKEWLLYKHYAKRIPSISYAFGLFDSKMMQGILTVGKPASNALCIGVCGKHNSNWIYTGLSAKRTERYDINNPNRHSKSVTDSKNVKYQELAVRDRPQKHRYIFFIGSKKQKKQWLKDLNYKIQAYPKGQNTNYDTSYKTTTQTELF